MGKVIAVVNQKGGVGKTTTAISLGAALAEEGQRVLIVDMDAQGNTTTGLGVERQRLDRCVYDVLVQGQPLRALTRGTSVPRLYVVPARMQLAAAEIELVSVIARETVLRRAVESVAADYDYIFLDAPPSLGILTLNCLVAADSVLIPMQCEYYALEGLAQLQRVIGMVKASLNPELRVEGVLLTMFDRRTTLSHDVAREIRAHFPDRVFETVIPRSVRLGEAPSYGRPITQYRSDSRGAAAYRALAKEVLENAEIGSWQGA